MPDLDSLARETCNKYLSISELKEICRRRGFSLPSGNKEAVAAFVAARLLEASGVVQAIASLDERGVLLLHAIKLKDNRATVEDLRPIVQPGAARSRWLDDRAVFQNIAGALLTRGVVLLRDNKQAWSRESRLSRVQFVFPEQFHRWLPHLPIESARLAGAPERRSPLEFLSASLKLKVQSPPRAEQDSPVELLDEVANLWSLHNKLEFADKPAGDWLAVLRDAWAKRWMRKVGRRSNFLWAFHALQHLPDGHGVTQECLASFLEKVSVTCSGDHLAGFLQDGLECGLLVRSNRSPGNALWSINGEREKSGISHEANARGISCQGEGVCVEIGRQQMIFLLNLAPVSFVVGSENVKGNPTLVLSPDTVTIGRCPERSRENQALTMARAVSPVFERACRLVEERHGQLIIHKEVSVFRIADQALLSLVSREFAGRLRKLGDQYLAISAAASDELEKFIAGHGCKARRVS